MHVSPEGRFFVRYGFHRPICRSVPVPRFRCKACGRLFSRQTFRFDYRDHRPDLNARVFLLLCSGVGLRQTSRLVGIATKNLEKKFRKIGRHCRLLNRNTRKQLPAPVTLQMDEMESYEGRRRVRPVTVPTLIERSSRLILDMSSAPIRPSGQMSAARRAAIHEDEKRHGKRPSRSMPAVRRVLRVAGRVCEGHRAVVLQTDQKSTYPNLARSVLGRALVHERTSSRVVRDVRNPLFPINHTEAMARDLIGRLRRRSWLVSKKRWCLNLHMHIYMCYRNLCRPRFNGERATPAQLVGWVQQRLRPNQILSWCQEFGSRSGHPLSMNAEPVGSR